jgi:hypothetical protein
MPPIRLPVATVLALGFLPLLCGLVVPADAHLDPRSGLTPYQATYSVYLDGFGIGHSRITLQRKANGTWWCHSFSRPNGLFALFENVRLEETSRFRLRPDGRLEPLTYRLTEPGRSARHDQEVRFDWPKRTVYSRVGSKRKTFPLRPGMLDRLTAQIALSRDLVRTGKPPASFLVVNHNHVHHYVVTRKGQRAWRTPAGVFQTIEYVARTRKGALLIFWCAPALGEIPVVARDKRHHHPTITLRLLRFSSLPSRSPVRSRAQVLGKVTPF